LNYMKEREMLSLLVEGGSMLASSMMEQGLIDEIILFKAPKIFGNGLGMFNLQIDKHLIDFYLYDVKRIDDDMMLRYIKNGTLD